MLDLFRAIRVFFGRCTPMPAGLRLASRATSGQVHVTGLDADRILLIIDRPGADDVLLPHARILARALAQQSSDRSGRGTDVDVIAEANLSAGDCAVALDSVKLGRFDCVILMLGSSHLLKAGRPQRWSQELGVLLDVVEAGTPHRGHTFVLELPAATALPYLPRALLPIVQKKIGRFNEAAAAVCHDRNGVSFLPFSVPDFSASKSEFRESSENWASSVAPALRAYLDSAGETVRQLDVLSKDARAGSGSDDAIIDTFPDAEVDRILTAARVQLGAATVAVTFVDNHQCWVKSAVGDSVAEVPAAGSLCYRAIGHPGLFVAEDVRETDYCRESTGNAAQIAFYAAHPIESPTGRRLGVVSVFDSKPRSLTPTEGSMIRSLARQVQDVQWAQK